MLVWRRWARREKRTAAWASWLDRRRKVKEVMVRFQCSLKGLTTGLSELSRAFADLNVSLAALNDVLEERKVSDGTV